MKVHVIKGSYNKKVNNKKVANKKNNYKGWRQPIGDVFYVTKLLFKD
jgi:hypothetical protein